MHNPDLHIHLTVDEVLQQFPQAFSVFVKHRTKCPGCFMQQFCTLEDVAATYQIASEELVAEIKYTTE